MRPKRITILTLLLILTQLASFAQFDEQLKHHIIIVRDEVLKKEDPDWPQSEESYQRVFNHLLGDNILRERDFISFVGFSTDERSNNLDDFSYTIIDSSWITYSNTTKAKIHENWNAIMDKCHRRHKGAKPFSMISLAKMYAFAPVKKTQHNQYVNRTFIIFISDHQYNGGDFYEERFALKDFNAKIAPKMTQEYGQRISAEYYVRQINDDYEKPKGNHYIDLLEYIPLQSGLTLPSLLDYSAGGITARRIKGGIYHIDINTSSRHNPHYNILQLHYRIMAADNTVLLDTICRASIGSDGDYVPIEHFDVPYEIGTDTIQASVTIDAWASLNDGIYDATVLTPVAGAPDYLASKGLSVTIPINYEPTSKILGIRSLPLPGFLQFGDDQEISNTIASSMVIFILVALFLTIAFWIIHRIRNYRIKANDITINRI